MKDKNKKILKNIIDVCGYTSAISYTGLLGYLIYKTRVHGYVKIASTKIIGTGEIIGAGLTVSFLLYKIYQTLKVEY